MNGWIGRILRVDLTSGAVYKEELNRTYAVHTLGQRGLALRYCLEASGRFVLMTGPLTGLLGACTNQFSAAFCTPAHNRVAAVSAGGHLGPELKLAGYDGMILEGVCEQPSYLTICNGQVELLSAEEIWGKGVRDTTAYLLSHTCRQARVLCIGTAGERRSPMASAVSEAHFSLGSGAGAVLGSMGLKGISIRGTGAIKLAHVEEYWNGAMQDRQALMDHPVTVNLGNDKAEQIEALMQEMENDPERIFAGRKPIQPAVASGCNVYRRSACYSCPIGCHSFLEQSDGTWGMSPSYMEGWAFGKNCGLSTLSDRSKAVWQCREYGLDPVMCSRVVGSMIAAGTVPKAFALEEPPHRGELDSVLSLIHRIGTGVGEDPAWEDAWSRGDEFPKRTKAQVALESAGICPVAGAVMTLERLADRLTSATGEAFSTERLEAIGVFNLELER